MILRLRPAIAILTCSSFLSASVAPANIGFLIASGDVEIDGQRVPGNSAIFAGSHISSGDKISNLQFADGTSAVISPSTKVTVYKEHSILQQGIVMQRDVGRHPIFADGLRISSEGSSTAVLVHVKDNYHLEVSAQNGEAEIRTSSGNLIAEAQPGQPLAFAFQQAATTSPSETQPTLCGKLGGDLLLLDQFTNVTYKLQGTGLRSYVGAQVRVTGVIESNSPSPQIFDVSDIEREKKHPCEATILGPGAAPAAVGGIDTRTWFLLIGIAAAGTLLGLGAAGTFSSPPPVTPSTP
jgi:hypothetical protein